MEKRPRLQLPKTAIDKKIEIVGILFLVILWGFFLYSYSNLPNTIPTHFNFSGKADAHGKKETILLLPVIATVIYIGLSYLCKFPHLFNYPVLINSKNAEKQYRIATRILRLLKITVLVVFGLIVFFIHSTVNGNTNIGANWFILLIVLLPLVPGIWGIRQSFRNK